MLRGKSLSLAEALTLEFRLASHIVTMADFREGIDAKIVGKGRAPNWAPETVAAVDDSSIERLFETPVDGELELNEPKHIF
jgi:enoyl-CoA hydratase